MTTYSRTVLATAFVGVSACFSGASHAALLDRGGGLLYDDVLNVTWLQDANYARTSGYSASGGMTWSAASTWAANLTFHDSVRHVDYSDWRLPTTAPVGADWNYNWLFDGSSDAGFNITSPASELAYMYYVNLGLKGAYSPSGTYQPDSGLYGNGTGGGDATVGLVHNLQSGYYWSGTVSMSTQSIYCAWGCSWAFLMWEGQQDANEPQDFTDYAWAVRAGDVAAVSPLIPEPETYAMLLAGLGLLGFVARRRKTTTA